MAIPRIDPYPMPGASVAPAARVGWRPDAARAVLLIHDMQDYFLDPFRQGAEPLPTLVRNILRLRQACDAAHVPVVYSAQPPEQAPVQRGLLQPWWGAGVTACPERAAITKGVAPGPHHRVLAKWRYSAFVNSGLEPLMRLEGRDQIIVTGVYAHIGCMSTALDAFMRDIQPFVVADAMADFSLDRHTMALRHVSGTCGIVADTIDVLAALSAGAPVACGAGPVAAEAAP